MSKKNEQILAAEIERLKDILAKTMQALEDQADVNNVYTNFEMTAELAAELAKG